MRQQDGPPENGAANGASRQGLQTAQVWKQAAIVVAIAAAIGGLYAVTRSRSAAKPEAAANALDPNQALVTQAAAAAIELKTARVELEPGKHIVRTNGVVHFSPYDTINVSPRLVGRVRSVFVKVGDSVTTGEPLLEMVSTDAANAVDTARDADAQYRLTSSALTTARRQFVLGTPEVTAAEAALYQAHENSLLNHRLFALAREQNRIGGFTDKPLTDAQSAAKQADTQLAQDEKDLALAQKQYDRTVKLVSIGLAAVQDRDAADDTLGKAKDAVTNDQEQSRIAHVTLAREQKAFDSKLYANQTLRQAEANYDQALLQERSAATALRMAKAALYHDLQQAEHDFNTATADAHAAHTVLTAYDNPTPDGIIIVRAPADGMVTARSVNPGQMVDQTGQTPWQMITIVNVATVYLDAQVYEKDMRGVKVGDTVTAASDALPAGYVVTGHVSYVAPGLDPTTHALSVRAALDNRRGLLKDGMFVNAAIDLGTPSPFLPTPIVPLTAVVHDGDNDYVFIAAGGLNYLRRQVTLGDQRGEGRVAIVKGLTGGEMIVTHGALYLGAGGTAAD